MVIDALVEIRAAPLVVVVELRRGGDVDVVDNDDDDELATARGDIDRDC